jgi:hypothetical protein
MVLLYHISHWVSVMTETETPVPVGLSEISQFTDEVNTHH